MSFYESFAKSLCRRISLAFCIINIKNLNLKYSPFFSTYNLLYILIPTPLGRKWGASAALFLITGASFLSLNPNFVVS